MSLKGKRFIVTGAASGMGAATAVAYAREGAQVIGIRHDRAGEDVLAATDAAGAGSFDFVHCDVSDREQVPAAVAEAVARLGGLDGLVHAAGIAPGAPVEAIDYDEFERVFAVNMRGTYLTNQAVFPHLREHGGKIINFASPVGVNGMAGKAHYAASKGAVLAWTRSLAREWGVHRITVNAIAPAIWTPMYDRTRAAMSPEQLAEHDRTMARIVPLGGKLGDIDRDFVPFMIFLGGDGAGFLTGQTYVIDGGALILS
jgi:NAD(P)-dependent dehydrogenase (short-subunit alcohol dehydrogenase family)